MVEGILLVNLDPPYVSFVEKAAGLSDGKRMRGALRNCTVSEMRQMLLDLGAITPQQHWPLKDCTISLPVSYSSATLHKLGLE
ncbi:MAG: hypothetical protein K2X27_22460 [Candidatus Obscuribacterales bacterium]|nr:hypothetical protein [Candidatus Obscuribacterales bacterium]